MDGRTDKSSGNAGGNKEPAKKPNKNNAEKQANRILYITVAMTLVVMAVIVAATSIANRTRPRESSGPITNVTTPALTAETTTGAPVITTETEEVIAPQTDEPDVPTENKLPEFSVPVAGALVKSHNDSTLVFSVTMKDWRVHTGIDIAAGKGSAVAAAADGVVKEIRVDPMMGMSIYVEHNGGAVSIYKNLGNSLGEGIAAGAKVKSGQTIGYVGETAIIEMADEPHLHFELEINGKSVNPLDYFSAATMSSLQEPVYEG